MVNALLVPYLLSAIRMMESGFATVEDIDAGMARGCAHPMGPLRLADLIGLDTTKAIAESMYAEFKEPLHSPPPVLCRMVDAGLLGRKSGRGTSRAAAASPPRPTLTTCPPLVHAHPTQNGALGEAHLALAGRPQHTHH